MIIGGNINGTRVYKQQVHKLENNIYRGNEGAYNQFQILQMTCFESYNGEITFKVTSIDPTRKIERPKRINPPPVLDKADEYKQKKMDSSTEAAHENDRRLLVGISSHGRRWSWLNTRS